METLVAGTRGCPCRRLLTLPWTVVCLIALTLVSSRVAAGEPASLAAPPPPQDAVQETAPAAGDDTDTEATAAELLSRAEDAITSIEYQRSRALAERAIAKGGLGIEELTRAHRIVAVSMAQVDDTEAAERAFLRLFALEPQSNVASRLSPARRTALLNARGFWSVHKNAFGLDVNYARHDRQIAVQVRDPIKWARTVHVWSRFGDRPFLKTERPAGDDVLITVPDIAEADALEVYAFVVDDHRNVLMQFGRERAPHVFALTDQEFWTLTEELSEANGSFRSTRASMSWPERGSATCLRMSMAAGATSSHASSGRICDVTAAEG